jgi:hypothetical protein
MPRLSIADRSSWAVVGVEVGPDPSLALARFDARGDVGEALFEEAAHVGCQIG